MKLLDIQMDTLKGNLRKLQAWSYEKTSLLRLLTLDDHKWLNSTFNNLRLCSYPLLRIRKLTLTDFTKGNSITYNFMIQITSTLWRFVYYFWIRCSRISSLIINKHSFKVLLQNLQKLFFETLQNIQSIHFLLQ